MTRAKREHAWKDCMHFEEELWTNDSFEVKVCNHKLCSWLRLKGMAIYYKNKQTNMYCACVDRQNSINIDEWIVQSNLK